MKMTIYVLAVAQVLLFLLMMLGTGMPDPAGNAMAGGILGLGGILLVMFLLPAVLLARAEKALPLAFGLTVIPLILLVMVAGSL